VERPELTSGKVLQSVLVVNGIRRVGLCKFQDFGKVLSEMRNNGVGDLRDMEESVAMLLVVSPGSGKKAYIKSMDQ